MTAKTSLVGAMLLVMPVLGACGGSPAVLSARVRGPDGEDNWIAITCERSQMLCVQRAGQSCPHGYDVANAIGHEGQASEGSYAANGRFAVAQVSSSHTYDGELLVKCRGQASAEATAEGFDLNRFRKCMADASCETADHCVFSSERFGETGRCRPR